MPSSADQEATPALLTRARPVEPIGGAQITAETAVQAIPVVRWPPVARPPQTRFHEGA